MPSKTEKIIIGKDGVARGIHGPLVAAVTEKLGTVEIMRASHVEPTGELSQLALTTLLTDPAREHFVTGFHSETDTCVPTRLSPNPEHSVKWWADMTPVAAGVILGPFTDRDTALREEVKWLEAHNIPVCHSCRERGT